MEQRSPRRLTAVWFADIVGYSSLSSSDEDAALVLVGRLQEAARREVDAQGGRVVKFVGDAVLAVFESVDGALRAALAVQDAFRASDVATRHGSSLRIGLHLGEIAEASDGDVYGDGVNVAARLQGKAGPGQILVSPAATEMVRGRTGYVFRRLALWRHLKGLGFTRVYVATATDAPPVPRRPLPSRAIGAGLTAGIAGFVLLMSFVAMNDDGTMGSVPEPLAEELIVDGGTALNLGMEHYFAGELDETVRALEPFTRAPLSAHPDAAKALRFMARAQLEADRKDLARATLDRMLEAEPPLRLLIPSAEEEELMSLYYDARRGALQGRAAVEPTVPVGAVVLFDLEVVFDRDDPNLETMGATVANMLASELEDAGVPTQYFWALMVGITGERAYQEFNRPAAPDSPSATHALLGRVLLHGDEVAVAAQVYELRTGAMVSSHLEPAAWPDGFIDAVEGLGAAVSGDLRRAPPANWGTVSTVRPSARHGGVCVSTPPRYLPAPVFSLRTY
jgi:class 3 adenylate cyclase